MDPAVATEAVLQQMMRAKNNLDFLETLTDDM